MSASLVFLVPGFFGFTSAGAVNGFADVERFDMRLHLTPGLRGDGGAAAAQAAADMAGAD